MKYYYFVSRNLIDVYGGPLYGTKYSLENACSVCGTGAIPTGPLILRMIKTKKEIFLTLGREVIVSSRIGELLTDVGVTSLAEVRQVKTGDLMPFKHLRPEAVLPPFSRKKTTGYERENPCPHCDRDGYFNIPHVPLLLKYENIEPILQTKNVLATWECFGNSKLRTPFKDSVFASPKIIVNHTVAETLKNANVKGIEFTPVSFSQG